MGLLIFLLSFFIHTFYGNTNNQSMFPVPGCSWLHLDPVFPIASRLFPAARLVLDPVFPVPWEPLILTQCSLFSAVPGCFCFLGTLVLIKTACSNLTIFTRRKNFLRIFISWFDESTGEKWGKCSLPASDCCQGNAHKHWYTSATLTTCFRQCTWINIRRMSLFKLSKKERRMKDRNDRNAVGKHQY